MKISEDRRLSLKKLQIQQYPNSFHRDFAKNEAKNTKYAKKQEQKLQIREKIANISS